jgi:hypothetical protein
MVFTPQENHLQEANRGIQHGFPYLSFGRKYRPSPSRDCVLDQLGQKKRNICVARRHAALLTRAKVPFDIETGGGLESIRNSRSAHNHAIQAEWFQQRSDILGDGSSAGIRTRQGVTNSDGVFHALPSAGSADKRPSPAPRAHTRPHCY